MTLALLEGAGIHFLVAKVNMDCRVMPESPTSQAQFLLSFGAGYQGVLFSPSDLDNSKLLRHLAPCAPPAGKEPPTEPWCPAQCGLLVHNVLNKQISWQLGPDWIDGWHLACIPCYTTINNISWVTDNSFLWPDNSTGLMLAVFAILDATQSCAKIPRIFGVGVYPRQNGDLNFADR